MWGSFDEIDTQDRTLLNNWKVCSFCTWFQITRLFCGKVGHLQRTIAQNEPRKFTTDSCSDERVSSRSHNLVHCDRDLTEAERYCWICCSAWGSRHRLEVTRFVVDFLTETGSGFAWTMASSTNRIRNQKEVLVQDSSAAQTDDKISNWMAGIAVYLPRVCCMSRVFACVSRVQHRFLSLSSSSLTAPPPLLLLCC